MKLYQINEHLEQLLQNSFDHETGELTNANLEGGLEDTLWEKEQRALDLACYIKNLDAEAVAIGDEIEKLKKRQNVINNKRARITEYLSSNLTPDDKYKDSRAVISWRKSESVHIDDYNSIDIDYLRVIPEKTEPDKMAIKMAIKAGEVVNGAELVTKHNLQIK